jgi:hypothetical protein
MIEPQVEGRPGVEARALNGPRRERLVLRICISISDTMLAATLMRNSSKSSAAISYRSAQMSCPVRASSSATATAYRSLHFSIWPDRT